MRRLASISAALFLTLCAGAQAGFAPENDVIANGIQVDPAGIATDATGDTFVTWNEQPAPKTLVARGRWVSASGDLGPVVELGAPGTEALAPKTGAAPPGRAFVAWRALHEPQGSDLVGRWVNRDGSAGPLLTISELVPGVAEPVEVNVAVDPAGVATVVWRNEKSGFGAIELRRVRPDGSMTETVPKAGTGVTGLSIGALPNGGTIAAWRDGEGTTVNVIGPDLSVGVQHSVSIRDSTANPELAVAADGNSFVSWRESPVESTFAVDGIRLDPAGQPTSEELVLAPKSSEGFESGGVGADSFGNFLPTFARYPGNGTGVLYARGVEQSGLFAGPAEPISGGSAVPESIQPALFDSGAGVIVWNDYFSGKGNQTIGRPVNRAGAPSGEPVVLSNTRSPISSSVPALGIAAFFSTDEKQVLVRRFLEPPKCANGKGVVNQGRPTAISLACTGAGLESGQATSPPAHGTLGSFDGAGRTVTYTPKPGFAGTDSFSYSLANDGGASNAATVTIEVGKDTVKPRIKKLRFVRKGSKARFIVRLSEPGRVKITVDRSRGPKRKPKIVGKAKSKKAGLKLTIPVKGKLAIRLKAGGRFRATAIAIDLAGNKSKPKRLRFQVG
jgi:hypothetical protein